MNTVREPAGSPSNSTRVPGKKLFLAGAFALAVIVLYLLLADRITLDALAERESMLREFQKANPWFTYVAVFCIYVTVTGLSLPGATPMSLLIGWYFGLIRGVILVSFASTTGATVAFLLSRHLLRESIQSRFAQYLKTFNNELDRDGPFYLFTLRLIPAVPFFVINVVMGLTRVRVWTFWWVSQIGMLAGTIVYVYAGSSIPDLTQLADPSQLRPHDVTDWPALVSTVGSGPKQSSTGQSIYRQLDQNAQQILGSLSNESASPTKEQAATLLQSLNTALAKPDFALQPDWKLPDAHNSRDADTASNTAAILNKQLTALNRTILVAAMPQIISAPQPILNRRLILAFVLLGTFPIVVRRLMSRFGKTPDTEDRAKLEPSP
jgi:uncharacterized membrane protein YdjX (TVP38/TMEM64 family)